MDKWLNGWMVKWLDGWMVNFKSLIVNNGMVDG